MDDALKAWHKLVKGRTEFSDIEITRGPEISKTEKWRWWRCGLADGTRISLGINEKGAGEAGLGLAHEKLESPTAIEHWRAYWKELLAKLQPG